MSSIEFDEDRTILAPFEPEVKIPDKGFEGWFYKKFPGSFNFKRNILIGIIFLLFVVAIVLFIIARYNVVTQDESYFDRIDNTKIN